MSLALPAREVGCERIFELAQFFQFSFGFGEGRLGHGNDAATRFSALAAQAHDAVDFIKTEAERLRFADEAHLVQRGVVIYAIITWCPRWLREKPAPLVKADGIGLHSRKLCKPPN